MPVRSGRRGDTDSSCGELGPRDLTETRWDTPPTLSDPTFAGEIFRSTQDDIRELYLK